MTRRPIITQRQPATPKAERIAAETSAARSQRADDAAREARAKAERRTMSQPRKS